eukprot:jgi/Chlat1/3592/Chrsp234S00258
MGRGAFFRCQLVLMAAVVLVTWVSFHLLLASMINQDGGDEASWTTLVRRPWHWSDQQAHHKGSSLSPALLSVLALQAGNVFSWGKALGARVGRAGLDADLCEPGQVLGVLKDVSVVAIAASGHSLALDIDGHVYAFGRNESGQLSYSPDGQPPVVDAQPGLVAGLLDKRMVSVAAGRYHSAAVTDSGEVWTWGRNDHGQCGRGRSAALPPGRVLGILTDKHIRKVVAGRYHTLAISSIGEVLTWGLNCVVPGLDVATPRVVDALKGVSIVGAAAGYLHWVAVSSEGAVYTADTGYDGYGELNSKPNQCGQLGRSGNTVTLRQVEALHTTQETFFAVAAGRCHTLAVSASGKLYSWGGSNHGELGRDGDPLRPGLVQLPDGVQVAGAAAGEYYSVAWTKDGQLWTFGDNAYCQMGRGLALSGEMSGVQRTRNRPAMVDLPGLRVLSVAGGFQHALAVVTAALSQNSDGAQPKQSPQPEQSAPRQNAALRAIDPAVKAELQRIKAEVAAQRQARNELTAESALSIEKPKPTLIRDLTTKYATRGMRYLAEDVTTQFAVQPLELGVDDDTRRKDLTATDWTDKLFYSPPNRTEVVMAAQDAFDGVPAAFDLNFKNPCWREPASRGTLHCLPYFHILGVSKCGTTDVYHRLSMHPDVYESINKGPHWFDEQKARPFSWYRDIYNIAAEKIALNPAGIVGDASSNTFTYNGVGMRGRIERRVYMAEVMRALQPDLKLMVMFRNPVDRLYSSYWYYHDYKNKPNATVHDFSADVDRAIAAWSNCIALHTDKFCSHALYHSPAQQLIKGMYSLFLPPWWNVYPREQFLFLRLDDYAINPKYDLLRIIKFLGLRLPTEAEWSAMLSLQVKNTRKTNRRGNSASVGSMLHSTRMKLEEFYRPYNVELAKQLSDDGFRWDATRAILKLLAPSSE